MTLLIIHSLIDTWPHADDQLGSAYQLPVTVSPLIISDECSGWLDDVVANGIEIWGRTRSLEVIEQVQLCAFCMLFEVGTLHPKASLMMEIAGL